MTAKDSNSTNPKSTPSTPENKDKAKVEAQVDKKAPSKAAVATPQPATNQERSKPNKGGLYLGIAAIILSAGLSSWLYWHHQQTLTNQQSQLDQLENQILDRLQLQITSALDQQQRDIGDLKALNQATSERNKALEQSLQAQAKQATLIEQDIGNLQRNIAEMDVRRPSDWMLAEAEYLMRMAGRKLWLEHDVKSSIALLLATDQRITELSDPSLNPLRQAIINDISQLEALPDLDKDGLVLRLTSLEQQIDKLNIAGIKLPEVLTETDNTLSSDISDWQDNLKKSWRSFADSFITIERRDGKVEALLAPDQAWYLKENIKNQLVKAQLAVYREHQAIYTESLEKAASWINQYYDQNNPNTQYLVESLTELSKKAITVQYPDQLKSKPILEDVIDHRVKKSLSNSMKQELSND
ncbi:uroporphyrinogen-III C-methyltransferase [Motilimonas sp. 1_MG-2023]|uniref:uroporphyrinogen-III C-methyltransferase n=1 Tax=Motilimonas sp. 1_MG-2023 TaxID=3062672 RepID=UPI0026E29036|nr:uroporphyrinogen-III C-methyltransferase [Motilimonas sp. 1_MG-2023]MDO6526007.1 uroporphyrinogen-III C-methyltransferase [Motilimonas sp. 1_MG-2023]